MSTNGTAFFDDLYEIYQSPIALKYKYAKMRSLLERLCKMYTAQEALPFSNLFARLNHVCASSKLGKQKTFRVHNFRIIAEKVSQEIFLPNETIYLQHLSILADTFAHILREEIPLELALHLPQIVDSPVTKRSMDYHERIRVQVIEVDDEYIYAIDEEHPADEQVRIRFNELGVNLEFNQTVRSLWNGAQLNLIQVHIDDAGIYHPELLIVEPDYLLDISAIAECMKDYGRNPLHYLRAKFEPSQNTKYILLGNIANLFLDEFVNEDPNHPIQYMECIKKAFKLSPFEFATCEEIDQQFFEDTKTQFDNIKRIVKDLFPRHEIDREQAIIEPNFLCEQLGIQGRLDYLQLGNDSQKKIVIELKSGKAPIPDTNHHLIGLNHQSQAFLYQIMIQKILGVEFKDLKTYILYSRYLTPESNLRLSHPHMSSIKEILNIRNLIVANERSIAADKHETTARELISRLVPSEMITSAGVNNNFLDRFIIPQIQHFQSFFQKSSDLELAYFYAFYAFVTKEHYLAKAGDTEYDSNKGLSSLWLSSIDEKLESGEILIDLNIIENHTESDSPTITFKIPMYDDDFLPNFREGDIVILYQRNVATDNVTNKQIFKGTIAKITPESVSVRIRYKQRNQSVLPVDSLYAIEKDFLDSSYTSMYRGLYAFLMANKDRKELLLHQRTPQQDLRVELSKKYASEEIDDIVYKAKAAKDYFLLVGPPGTGKTSMALKSIVEEFYSNDKTNILLLSYTNRAVDEICEALETIENNPEFIRIGTELSCEPRYRKHLLNQLISDCENRNAVKKVIERHRIFVGTVSSLSNKTELFKLKQFQVAIIDEASQILEPSLLGLLSAKTKDGKNALAKFILIGDHKQLPAVVLQNEEDSKISNPELNAIGITNRRNSLFERLFDIHKEHRHAMTWSMLQKQGRMHPTVALFPNEAFYNGQLHPVPVSHQQEDLPYICYDNTHALQKLVATERLSFISTKRYVLDKNNKSNTNEAKIVAALVYQIYTIYQTNKIDFVAEKSLGIITPYRSQIALIRKELHRLAIPALQHISIDTVERYQGSQRDIIIYSFSINKLYQLDALASNICIDNGQHIDRKLNVALTRARKQLFIVGNKDILSHNATYKSFIEHISTFGTCIDEDLDCVIQGEFQID